MSNVLWNTDTEEASFYHGPYLRMITQYIVFFYEVHTTYCAHSGGISTYRFLARTPPPPWTIFRIVVYYIKQ